MSKELPAATVSLPLLAVSYLHLSSFPSDANTLPRSHKLSLTVGFASTNHFLSFFHVGKSATMEVRMWEKDFRLRQGVEVSFLSHCVEGRWFESWMCNALFPRLTRSSCARHYIGM